MTNRIEVFGEGLEPVLFAHANGYPPGSYRQLFAALTDRCRITAVKHRPLWSEQGPPTRLNWSVFTDDMMRYMPRPGEEPVWLMGHSMGGIVAIHAALRRPTAVRGLILIDPVLLPTRDVLAMRLTPASQRGKIPIIRGALGRPHHFENYQAAFDFYRRKGAFRRFSDQALWDYVHAAKHPTSSGGVQLSYSGEWEAKVYTSGPWIWPQLPRLGTPTLGLVGKDSDLISEATIKRWEWLQPSASLQVCPGGHLLPMEYPEDVATRVLRFMDTLDS